jgi:hypothetical protein
VSQEYARRFRGVSYRPGRSRPWRAYISVDGKQKHLGWFATDDEAAVARQKMGAAVNKTPRRWVSAIACMTMIGTGLRSS